jgi:hypothetical protein
MTAVGIPDPEPSKADLLRAFQQFHDQTMAGLAEIRQMLNEMPAAASSARNAEPLPNGLDTYPPMREFLIDEPD